MGVEGEAAFLAARYATPDCIGRMKAALESINTCAEDGGLGADEDIAFHLAVAGATQNEYYLKTIESVSKAVMIGMKIARTLSNRPASERLQTVYREHEQILQAISAGDAEQARRRMRSHIESARTRVFVGSS